MKKVLFPIDFSESATNALSYAGEFAKKNDCELVLYNSHGVLKRGYLEDAMEKLNAVAKDISHTYKINCRKIAEPTFGGLSKHINLTAETFDLVIMGTSGADTFLKFFTGSNAYNAILKANIPFLIIPLGFKEIIIKNVVYAYDYSMAENLPTQQLLPFFKTLGSKSLTILRVIENDNQPSVENFREELCFQLKDHKGLELKFESLYSTSTTADTIHQYMAKRNTTALFLCTQRRDFIEHLFHKSVIKEISARANYPLFIFHQ